MEFQNAVSEFGQLRKEQQIRLLILYGHNLTIVARDTYEVQGPRVLAPERLRRINEIQHRVFGALEARVDPAHRWQYPDDTLLSILLQHGEEGNDDYLRSQTEWAFEDALKTMRTL